MNLNEKRLRLRIRLLIAAAVVVGAGAAADASAAKDKGKVQAKVHQGLLTVTGSKQDDTIALRLRPGDPSTLQLVVDGEATDDFKQSQVDRIVIDGAAGDDHLAIDESNGLFTDREPATLDGGSGDDVLQGSSAADTLRGGDGGDVVDGNRGADSAFLGAGDDSFVWDPGDGSDSVEGEAGADVLQFNGSNAAEKIDLSANGSRLRLFRDVAAITMDTAGVESVNVVARGSADAVTVNDLAGSGVSRVDADLGGADGAVDQLLVNGTAAADRLHVGAGAVDGLAARVSAAGAEPTDVLTVNGLAGDDRFFADPAVAPLAEQLVGGEGSDSVSAEGTAGDDTLGIAAATPSARVFAQGAAGFVDVQVENLSVDGLDGNDTIQGQNGLSTLTALTIDGGAGNDTLGGGDGDDTLRGGDGSDVVDGNRGADSALLGAGDDSFVWDPGDGSDSVEGEAGADVLQFNGSNAAEKIDLSANGSRLRLFRDVAAITMDTAGIESVNIAARGSADTITVGDLTGTAVTAVAADLGAVDGAADQLIAVGTGGSDVITVAGQSGTATVKGLAAGISITGAEAALDTLTAASVGGDDVIQASGLAADAIQLIEDGGAGDDVLVGGAGNDTLLGGAGDDVLNGGPGADTLDGGTGSNVLIQD